ncbi:UNVERIFIED_CONTAM: hypothetical protein FKN15_038893 [Acipenser sinensis]
MDPLEEDQLDEELMMEEGRAEEEEAVPDETQPSTSSVNMATTDADHAHSLSTKCRCTRRCNAPDRWSPDRSALARYTLDHTTASTPDASAKPAPGHFVDEESDVEPGFFTFEDADHKALRPLPFRPSRPVGVDLPMVTRALRFTTDKFIRKIDFVLLFFMQIIITDICKFTNAQGCHLVAEKPSYGNSQGGWNEVTPEELT